MDRLGGGGCGLLIGYILDASGAEVPASWNNVLPAIEGADAAGALPAIADAEADRDNRALPAIEDAAADSDNDELPGLTEADSDNDEPDNLREHINGHLQVYLCELIGSLRL